LPVLSEFFPIARLHDRPTGQAFNRRMKTDEKSGKITGGNFLQIVELSKLLDGHGLREVARVVDVAAPDLRDVVGEELQGRRHHDRR
jgi:hypothetical protein